MSEDSRSRVTVTFGRSGRVVKRTGPESDDEFLDSTPAARTKRSVRDRLGPNVDASSGSRNQPKNKRLRGETFSTSGVNGMRIGKDDLRLKLMQKSLSSKAKEDVPRSQVDFRDSLPSISTRPSIDSKTFQAPESTFSYRQRMSEPRDTSMLVHAPSSRSGGDLSMVDRTRASYTSWNLDSLRRRSPDGYLPSSASRARSPERNVEESQRRPLVRAYDDGKPSPYMRHDVSSRPINSVPFLTKPSVPEPPVKHVAPVPSQYPQPSVIAQRIPIMGDEQLTVESLLHSLGLEKYIINFKAEEVDMHALRQMGDSDLKDIGIPMGPRKKIVQAILHRFRRQP